jgi:hypothetical protein
MSGKIITVHAQFDNAAGVWFVEESDLHGLNVEAPTLEALTEKLPAAIIDLVENDVGRGQDYEIPVEIIAHQRSRVRIGRPA